MDTVIQDRPLSVIVTGATSGIGQALARGFANVGEQVLALGIGDLPPPEPNLSYEPVDEVSFLGRLVSGREYCGYGEYPAQTSLWREHGDQIGSLGRQEYENGAIPRRHGLFRGSSTDDLTHQ